MEKNNPQLAQENREEAQASKLLFENGAELLAALLLSSSCQEREKMIVQTVIGVAPTLSGATLLNHYKQLLQAYACLTSYLSNAGAREILIELFQMSLPLELLFDLAAFIETADQGYTFLIGCEKNITQKHPGEFGILIMPDTGLNDLLALFKNTLADMPLETLLHDLKQFYREFSRRYFTPEQEAIYLQVLEKVFMSERYKTVIFAKGFARNIAD